MVNRNQVSVLVDAQSLEAQNKEPEKINKRAQLLVILRNKLNKIVIETDLVTKCTVKTMILLGLRAQRSHAY